MNPETKRFEIETERTPDNWPRFELGQTVEMNGVRLAIRKITKKDIIMRPSKGEDNAELMKFVMDEKCTANEKHCTCVPLLRTKVTELQADLDAAYAELLKLRPGLTVVFDHAVYERANRRQG